MNIVVLGPPGAGKGTQGQLLSKHIGVPRVSTGDMLRAAVASGSALGQSVEATLASGDLVSAHIVLELIAERLREADCADGAIFDGFPRTIRQARALDKLLAGQQAKVDLVLNLIIDDDVLIKRIEVRKVDGPARPDDTAETLKNRLVIYYRTAPALIAFYQGEGKLEMENIMETITVVSDEIARVDNAWGSQRRRLCRRAAIR
ncbi:MULTISPECIES: adenylate kinase [Sphingosinicellaceae]|uniref:adenylate kinase n=1 Tax=Sphingosinicellaceae TaxID=2820280 RepID=UPI001C1E2577|nr:MULTISPECIES: adenylate kinase [Polymorphobacter]QYE33456.1 adenylate kinase [Polymorphobacter sp. PAMC 29334]UAJ12821.1 adenylate kinase [Polymorphobacter megasporae]